MRESPARCSFQMKPSPLCQAMLSPGAEKNQCRPSHGFEGSPFESIRKDPPQFLQPKMVVLP